MMERLITLCIDIFSMLTKGYYGSCASTNENSEISTWTSTQKASTRRFLEAQLDAYDQGKQHPAAVAELKALDGYSGQQRLKALHIGIICV